MIAGLAAAAGGLLGRIGLPALFARLEETFAGTERNSTLYSETMLGVRLEHELAMSADYRAVPVCVILVMAAALLLCLAFVPSAFAQGSLKRGRSRVRVPQGRTGSIGRGSLRFALLSIRRGGWRTLVVPAVCMALSFLVLVLGSVYAGWQSQLADALDHTRIEGMAVSNNGKYYSGLVVPVDHVQELCRLEDVESIAVSNGYPYWFRSEEPAFAQTSFGQESRMDWIRRQPQIVSLNDLSGARDFYYNEAVVEYLDGWDESFLAEADDPTFYDTGASMAEQSGEAVVYPAIVSNRFLEERGLAPGDTLTASFLVTKFYQEAELDTTLRIVGVYRQTGSKAQIYVPLAFSTPVDVLSGEEPEDLPVMDRYGWMNYSQEEMLRHYYYRQQTFETCRFTLASARKLSESRQHLEETGFSSVGRLSKIRTTLVLRDASFLKLTETLERYIATGRIILVLISLLVLLVGFIVSWLMIHSRRMEFALMRGLGTPGMRIFASFFTEQLLLCLLGCLLGAGASFGLGGIRADAFWAVGGFFACYLGGCAAAILLTGQMKLMELFTYRD
ncbi:MAG: hypothetical protein IJM26_04855 [Lachnospiraceae bacterium]|nr:hypothetical protein [Lachnospiraceae bacterium]